MIRKLKHWWNRGTCWWDKWNSWGGWFRCKRAEFMLEIYRPRIDRAPGHLPIKAMEKERLDVLLRTTDDGGLHGWSYGVPLDGAEELYQATPNHIPTIDGR